VGLGQIGRRVAAFASTLGMRVAAFDPFVEPAAAQALGVELTSELHDLLAEADIVSLHAPLTPETARLINRERLSVMKRGSILINTARGGLVDESALLDALKSGHLRGAGLDVFDPEPPQPDNELLKRADVIATPHIAGATRASKDRLWRIAIGQALQVLRGERPSGLANPEMWSETKPA
jgi:D-3-phosphoglycerate dehydrogenase